MDPVTRVKDFLLDNIGHMTHPGNASFDLASQRWFIPVYCRTDRGNVAIGDIELDPEGHIIYAPSSEEMIARLGRTSTAVGQSGL